MATKKTTVKKTAVKKTTAKKTAKKTTAKKTVAEISFVDHEPKKIRPAPIPIKHHIPLDGSNPIATANEIIKAGEFSTKNIQFVLTTIMREIAKLS